MEWKIRNPNTSPPYVTWYSEQLSTDMAVWNLSYGSKIVYSKTKRIISSTAATLYKNWLAFVSKQNWLCGYNYK